MFSSYCLSRKLVIFHLNTLALKPDFCSHILTLNLSGSGPGISWRTIKVHGTHRVWRLAEGEGCSCGWEGKRKHEGDKQQFWVLAFCQVWEDLFTYTLGGAVWSMKADCAKNRRHWAMCTWRKIPLKGYGCVNRKKTKQEVTTFVVPHFVKEYCRC